MIYNIPCKCYLFPSFSSSIIDFSTHSIDQILLEKSKEIMGIKNQNLEIKYVGILENYKMNVGENCFVNYKFQFYLISGITLGNYKKRFKINGQKFKWVSIDKMYANKKMMKKNLDVIDFVNDHTNISKI